MLFGFIAFLVCAFMENYFDRKLKGVVKKMRKDDNFGFFVPLEVDGIDGSVLDPRSTWANSSEYDLQAKKLVSMFIDNFVKFESDVEEKILNSGPSQI